MCTVFFSMYGLGLACGKLVISLTADLSEFWAEMLKEKCSPNLFLYFMVRCSIDSQHCWMRGGIEH